MRRERERKREREIGRERERGEKEYNCDQSNSLRHTHTGSSE